MSLFIILTLIFVTFTYIIVVGYKNNNLAISLVEEFKNKTFSSEEKRNEAKEELKLKLIKIKQRTLSISPYWTMIAKEKIQDQINLL